MGYTASKPVSLLASDCWFMIFALVAMIGYILSSSFLSAVNVRKYDFKYPNERNGITNYAGRQLYSERQETSETKDNVTLEALPDQPDRMVLLVLSVVASNTDISQSRSDAIITCLSRASDTDQSNWGAYRLQRFAPNLIQVEYYCVASEIGSLTVPEKIDEYIGGGNLTECVRLSDSGLPENGKLFRGRTVLAPESGSIVSSKGKIPGWSIAIVIGCIVGIGFIGICVLWWKGETTYKEEDYGKYEDDESVDDESMSGSEVEDIGERDMVDMVAGQERQAIVRHF